MTLGYSADCFFSASATVELFVPERGGFEFGEMIALSLLWPSQTRSSLSLSFLLYDIMIAGLCQIENITAVWRLYEITIYYV